MIAKVIHYIEEKASRWSTEIEVLYGEVIKFGGEIGFEKEDGYDRAKLIKSWWIGVYIWHLYFAFNLYHLVDKYKENT